MLGNALAQAMLFGWIPFTLLLYAVLSPRRAFLVSAIGGWLFLPVDSFPVPGFVDYSKEVAVSLAPLLGMLIFDAERLRAMRLHRADLFMLVWCLCPMFTSIMNDLGPYDGLAVVSDRLAYYYLPYVLGRGYFGTYAGLRELLIALFVGGLVYAPLCFWEARMSPQLHVEIYGRFVHSDWSQVVRFGGYRPMVFMNHGLMLGFFMAMATFSGVVLWWSGSLKRLLGIPMLPLILGMFAVNLAIKSSGSFVLLLLGCGVLWSLSRLRTSLAFLVIALVPLAYASLRAPGLWDGQNLVRAVASVINEERAESMAYRLEAEGLLAGKAMEQPIYGWGLHDRGRVAWVKSADGKVVADGLWIQAFNVNGIVGIVSLLGFFLVPALWAATKLKASDQQRRGYGLVIGTATLTSLYMIDNLLNAMVAPMYFTALGGLAGYCLANPGHFRLPQRPRFVPAGQRAWNEEREGFVQPQR